MEAATDEDGSRDDDDDDGATQHRRDRGIGGGGRGFFKVFSSPPPFSFLGRIRSCERTRVGSQRRKKFSVSELKLALSHLRNMFFLPLSLFCQSSSPSGVT